MKLILGSSSQFRQKVLRDAGVAFDVIEPGIDEKKIRAAEPTLIPVVLSYAKAQAVREKCTEPVLIIAADQIVFCNGHVLEKPESSEEVRAWYKMYPKYPVQYINGITVLNTETGASITAQEISIMTFEEIPEDFTEHQIEDGTIFKCSGGIGDALEQAYGTIVEGTLDSVIGLPVSFVMSLLEKVK